MRESSSTKPQRFAAGTTGAAPDNEQNERGVEGAAKGRNNHDDPDFQ